MARMIKFINIFSRRKLNLTFSETFKGIKKSKKFWLGVLLVILIATGVELSNGSPWMEMSENFYFDLWHHFTGIQYKPNHVVIVAIDDQTLLEHTDEPLIFWGPYFAQVIDVLQKTGVRSIGLDFLFSVSAESWLKKFNLSNGDEASRTYDLPLREQLASGKVVLAGNMVFDESGKQKVLLPSWDLWISLKRKLNDVGLTNFYSDADGVIRRFVPAYTGDNGEMLGHTFGWLLAERSSDGKPLRKGKDISYITYTGPPGTIPRFSFRLLLRPQAESDPHISDIFKDKVAIIAYEPSELQDIRRTPYARDFLHLNSLMMSGAEVHANIIETLLAGRFFHPVSTLFSVFYLLLMLILGTTLFFKTSPEKGIGVVGILSMVCASFSYLSFQSDWVLPVASVQLGLLFCYLGTIGIRLTGEERERARLRHIFGNFVHDKVIEKLLSTGKQPDLGGEERLVTVLFSDIRNFTTISEHITPHEVVEMLNSYFDQVCEPILENGGMVDKFIGDAIMAVFGYPMSNPDHARLAVKTAFALTEKAEDFRNRKSNYFGEKGLGDFHIGIGLHTGPAVVGLIGSSKRFEFTAIGDTVNTASRLESATKELGWAIIASRATIEAAGLGVVIGGQDKITVKGKKEHIEVYEVLGIDEK